MPGRAFLAVCAAIALTASAPTHSRPTTLSVAGRSNGTPWIAADGRFVAVAWGATAAAKTDVFTAVSRNGGQTFTQPVQVNVVAGEAHLGGEMPPRIALARRSGAGDPEIVVLWTTRGDSTALKTARSRDGGRTFDRPITMQSQGAPGNRGWPALATDNHGTAHVMWLDHRGLAPGGSGGMSHADHKTAASRDAMQMAGQSALYYAAAGDGASPHERELTRGVCYCCKTALAADANGALFAAWRHVYPGNLRDIAFSVSRDAGRSFSSPERVSEDKWALDGCPDDGPALAVDTHGVVHLVWPTVIAGQSPEGALFYASSRDGRAFTTRVRIPTLGSPKPSHPQIAVDASGRLTVAWDELVGGERVAALRQLKPQRDGTIAFGPIVRLAESGRATYPVMASASTGLVAAWISGAPEAAVISVRQIPNH
jgi:hypothetical protein